jgi:hypothetical protein
MGNNFTEVGRVLDLYKDCSFVVGKVFQHRKTGLVPQSFGFNFKTRIWEPAKERVISIKGFGNNSLEEYILPKKMNDTTISLVTNSSPMKEDYFWILLYLLIIKPKLGKKILKYELLKDKLYIMHLRLASGKVETTHICFKEGEWDFDAFGFDYYLWWEENRVFLYF